MLSDLKAAFVSQWAQNSGSLNSLPQLFKA